MKPCNVALIAMIALTLLAAQAGATMTYYDSQTSWAAATSGVFTIDFNDVVVPPSPGYVDYSTTGLQLHDVTFAANPATDGGILVGYYPLNCTSNAFGAGNNFLCGNTWDVKYFEAALPANVHAVAFQLLTATPGGAPVTLNFSTSDTRLLSTITATPVFAGFVFDQAVSWVRIEATSNAVAVDNFAYGQMEQMEETPEASTLLLAGAGLIGLLLARRLRRLC